MSDPLDTILEGLGTKPTKEAPIVDVTETEVVEDVEDGGPNTNDSINAPLEDVDDPVVLKKMIKSLRGEAAKNRKEKNAAKGELEEFRVWKDSQRSALEKTEEQLRAAEQKYLDAVADGVALKYGVPEDLREFVTGSDEAEMTEKAKKLGAKKSSAPTDAAVGVLAGNRGGSVGKSGKDSGASFLEGLFGA